jgi:hypothetical protein
MRFNVNASERLRITSDGKLGLGTSAPGTNLEIKKDTASTFYDTTIDTTILLSGTPGAGNGNFGGSIGFSRLDSVGRINAAIAIKQTTADGDQCGLSFFTHPSASTGAALSESLSITHDGKVGIGTTSPAYALDVQAGDVRFKRAASDDGAIYFGSTTNNYIYGSNTGNLFTFATNGSERARIDSSGRLLVGTSTSVFGSIVQAASTGGAQYEGARFSADAFGPAITLIKSRGASVGTNTAVQNGDVLGLIAFRGANGSDYSNVGAQIVASVDAEPFTSGDTTDLPTRLVFSTTADGASSPTERMRIGQDGVVLIGATTNNITDSGFFSQPPTADYYLGVVNTSSNSAVRVLLVNRQTSDGNLIDLRQANTLEGTISVSGTTVTYGGGHLARWSQLPNEEDPSGLLKGTVMSNLDEMCEWGEEDNEQLNKTKVSDVEGDPSVAGVFVSTSFSDEGPLDYFLAMTGDMIIRIAEGVTVQRGDLLMSAGDGTAKPQGDGFVQDKTIAKVTSTHVTCTYDDGSYCVPCVLMAC